MTSAIRAQRDQEAGFTLIELLVVVIIIGILAAIAIPAFLNQRERAWESELTSTVRNIALEVEAEATRFGGDYTDITDAAGTAGSDLVDFVSEQLTDLQGAAADPVIFTAGAADVAFNSTVFAICMTHTQLNDGATPPVATTHISYVSNQGGLTDNLDGPCVAGSVPLDGTTAPV